MKRLQSLFTQINRSGKQASQYARSLIEASLDPLVTISSEGKITDVNEATIKVHILIKSAIRSDLKTATPSAIGWWKFCEKNSAIKRVRRSNFHKVNPRLCRGTHSV